MKKLVSLIKIPEVTEAYDLEQEFKITRSNLKKYIKSLGEMKVRATEFAENLAKSNKALQNLCKDYYFKDVKKNTEMDYYTFHGTKIFKKLGDHMAKPIVSYQKIIKRIE